MSTEMPDFSVEELLKAVEATQPKLYSYTHALPITITCMNCRATFKGTIDVAKKWHSKDKRFYYPTFYCPNCPPITNYKDWMKAVLGISFIEVQTD